MYFFSPYNKFCTFCYIYSAYVNAKKKKAKSNQNGRTTKNVKPEDYELNKVLLDAVDIAIKRKQQKLQSVQNKLGKIRADEVIKGIV